MHDFAMTIDGVSRSGAQRFDVINPATGTPFATAPSCDRELLDEAFAAAARAFRTWRLDDDQRRDLLRAAGTTLSEHAQEIGLVLTQEQGKPIAEATREVIGAAMWFRYYADLDIEREILQDDGDAFVEVIRKPLGVVAAIAPWNFPIVLACWKLAPALRAGNTVVLKPSPYTPLSSLAMVEVLNRVLPNGVLNVVSGGDELGAWMTAHPTPRKVSFTGSVTAGKKVAASAGADLKRVTLELGGNDPAIVLDDADVEAVSGRLFKSAFANNGQVCVAVKRVYVPDALHDDLVTLLADQARATVVGDGMDPATQLGPINNAPQLERVTSLVARSLDAGAVPVAGGARIDRHGYFFEPTILTEVRDGDPLVDEEQFGPALPIVRYSDLDHVLERVNDSNYGLGASVWTADEERGDRVARRLDAGSTWVNTHAALTPSLPFGGMKWSGVGVENGPWGYLSFTDLQVVHRARA
jgi:acyl-CoA reductase-like NAD-dependent aldehyde dehydrogenase